MFCSYCVSGTNAKAEAGIITYQISADGYCATDIITTFNAGLAIHQINKAKSATRTCGYCASDIITKYEAGLAINQISNAEFEMMP